MDENRQECAEVFYSKFSGAECEMDGVFGGALGSAAEENTIGFSRGIIMPKIYENRSFYKFYIIMV
ncbi:MAG: hypothetical protein KAI29_24660 [Cyclobacteriaceae bacterium]|nr:hypothetical protein [Cyclobacteriaceae bacterium]